MANVMGLTVARDIHLAKLLGLDAPPRGRTAGGRPHLRCDQAHFSIARGLDMLGFPEATLRVVCRRTSGTACTRSRRRRHRRGPRGGAHAFCISAVAGSTNTGSVRPGRRAGGPGRAGRALAPRGRRVRRSRPPVGARCRSGDRPGSRRLRHDRSAQVVLPAVRHRRAVGEAARRPPEHVPPRARVLPGDGTRGQPLHWYQYSLEGRDGSAPSSSGCRWKHLGTEGFARLIEQNDDLAAYLAERLDREGFGT